MVPSIVAETVFLRYFENNLSYDSNVAASILTARIGPTSQGGNQQNFRNWTLPLQMSHFEL